MDTRFAAKSSHSFGREILQYFCVCLSSSHLSEAGQTRLGKGDVMYFCEAVRI